MKDDLIEKLHKEYEDISIKLARKGISTFITICNESKGFSIVCGDLDDIQLGLVNFMIKDQKVYQMFADAVNTASSILANEHN